jgi:hypothetical protein
MFGRRHFVMELSLPKNRRRGRQFCFIFSVGGLPSETIDYHTVVVSGAVPGGGGVHIEATLPQGRQCEQGRGLYGLGRALQGCHLLLEPLDLLKNTQTGRYHTHIHQYIDIDRYRYTYIYI